MTNYKRLIRWFAYSIGGMMLFCFSCSSSPSEAFRARYDSQYQVRGYQPTSSAVTGSACAQSSRDAVEAAQKAARFNLRSILGSERFLIQYQEKNRYRDGNQTCVEMIAIARKP